MVIRRYIVVSTSEYVNGEVKSLWAIKDMVVSDRLTDPDNIVSTHDTWREANNLCELANSAWRDGYELDKP
jgi:hypothetical protein